MHANIVALPGDGIGPEVCESALRVLKRVADKFGHSLSITEALIGGAAIDATGEALPHASLQACKAADGIFLGAVGGPKWSGPEAKVRPEQGLLALRFALELYSNLRPVKPHPALFDTSPIRASRLQGTDLIVVRELTGGIYFGEKTRTENSASDLCTYTVKEIERVARHAAKLAEARTGKLCSIDKSNVLETSRLWRETITRLVSEEFPDVTLEHLLVDAAAMHLIDRPSQFDVIVTENMFGDILTDEASMLAGSLGMLPSASLGDSNCGLYEPIHGSAPDIAGKGIANPCASIASIAMLLRHSLSLEKEALAVETALSASLNAGARTADIAEKNEAALSTQTMTEAVLAELN